MRSFKLTTKRVMGWLSMAFMGLYAAFSVFVLSSPDYNPVGLIPLGILPFEMCLSYYLAYCVYKRSDLMSYLLAGCALSFVSLLSCFIVVYCFGADPATLWMPVTLSMNLLSFFGYSAGMCWLVNLVKKNVM